MTYLKIEFLRSWRTFTMWMPVAIIAVSAHAYLLRNTVSANGLAPLHLYGGAILAPLALVLPVITEYREQRVRSGGTLWRPYNRWATYAARAGVAMAYVFIGHILAPLPLGGLAPTFTIVETLVYLGFYGIGMLLWRLLGKASLVVAPLWGFCYMVGTVTSDSPHWYLNPLTWPLRETLPIYGVHPNSVPAEAGDPVMSISIVWPLLLHLAAGLICFAAALMLPKVSVARSESVRERSLPTATRYSPAKAMALALPWRLWIGLTVLMLLILGLLRTYLSDWANGSYSLLAVRLASVIVGVTAWSANRDAMRGVLTRPAGRRAVSWISVSALAFLWVVLLAGGILTGCGLHQLLIALPLAAALYLASFLLAARSLPLALAPAIILYFWSIMACGNDITLNNPIIWRTGVMGWTLVPQDYPDRFWEMFIASVAASIAMKSVGDRWVRMCVVRDS